MNQDNSGDLLTTTNIQSYFHQSLQTALDNNKLRVEDETIGYLVRLLSNFLHSDKLFEESEDGLHIRPLALYYAEAISLSSRSNRHRVLQQLGDVALFISGLFADSLERKLVDVDYYIAMGGNAYGYLADNERRVVFAQIFAELSRNFVGFVDVLSEINESSNNRNHRNILRTYEIWAKTGSPRAARRLRALGIEPVAAANPRLRH